LILHRAKVVSIWTFCSLLLNTETSTPTSYTIWNTSKLILQVLKALFIKHENLWHELISCSPLIRHGPHRKQSLQQFLLQWEHVYHSVA
jgi:hypothetical protein